MDFVTPECKYGYPETQLKAEFGDDRMKAFNAWMRGQTFSSCDGKQYNYDKQEFEATNCGPHGYVYYVYDVNRFIAGQPVID